ncbi:MAG: anti-sigma factor antagonist [Chloroflexi bacterium]|nr:anti-sigma factor antagonist [Chloroflexota bacterium]
MQHERHLSFKPQLENIPSATEFVVEGAIAAGLDEREVYHCQLAVDEACTNIIQYGVPADADHSQPIEIVTGIDDKNAYVIIITDSTPAFNPLEHDDPNPKAKLEDRDQVGGWGIYFIKKLMDAVDYRYVDGKNRLTLHKFIPQTSESRHPDRDIYIASRALEKNYWQIDLAGRLDSKNSGTLEEILTEALVDQEHYRLIVNMDGVEYISSSGLKALVAAWRLARDHGGDVLLTNLQHRIMEIFDMIGFDMMFNIYETPADAIDADPIG